MKILKVTYQSPFRPPIFVMVDDEDYDFLCSFKWYPYTYNRTTYVKTYIGGKVISMQALLMKPPNKFVTVDHKDSNGLNNQKSNFRLATLQQQRQNKSKHEEATSNYKGVSWSKERNKWVAQICINGKQKGLGRFTSEIDAALAYNEAAKVNYGEFAKLNEIPRIN